MMRVWTASQLPRPVALSGFHQPKVLTTGFASRNPPSYGQLPILHILGCHSNYTQRPQGSLHWSLGGNSSHWLFLQCLPGPQWSPQTAVGLGQFLR